MKAKNFDVSLADQKDSSNNKENTLMLYWLINLSCLSLLTLSLKLCHVAAVVSFSWWPALPLIWSSSPQALCSAVWHTSACTSLPLSFELLLCFLAFFFSPRGGLNSIPGSFALIIMQMGRCQQIFDTFDTLTCLCLPQKHLMKSNTFSISIVLPETEIAIFCSLDRFPLQVLLTMVEDTRHFNSC